MRLNWKPSPRASAINLVRPFLIPNVFERKLQIESALLQVLTELSVPIQKYAYALSPLSPAKSLESLIASSATFNEDLSEHIKGWFAADPKFGPGDIQVVMQCVRDLESIQLEMQPKIADQLRYRIGPLTQQWDGYGNAIFAHLRRLTSIPRKTATVDVIPVSPVFNGDGFAVPEFDVVVMEALFVNPSPEMPEVLRLAWLAAQVEYAKACSLDLNSLSLLLTNAYALLPAVLAAGEIVELTKCDESVLGVAMKSCLPFHASDAETVGRIMHWWETYLQTKPDWSIALTALERALQTA